jgi:hypothetical protein
MKRTLLFALLFACRTEQGTTKAPRPEPGTTPKTTEIAVDEPAHLAGVFRHAPLQPLTITEHAIEKTLGRVQLDLKWFEISGVAPSVAIPLNAAIRTAASVDAWEAGDRGLDGAATARCEPGLAFVDLVSFGCDTLNDTRPIAQADRGEGGAPAGYTGEARTFAIADGKLVPIALEDLLRPGADLAAFARRVAGEGDSPIEDWRDGRCELGAAPVWQLDVDGLRLWDDGQSCNSLLVPYDRLVEIAEPGGVIARWVAITQSDAT